MIVSPSSFAPFIGSASTTIAVLIDGENLPKSLSDPILEAAHLCGQPRIRRVYGNANHISGWEDHGFRLCQTRPGKNSADMLLCIEAMMLALRDGVETIVIATSDRDFSYLAEQLRETGIQVIGMGTEKAAQSFRKACSAFHLLGLAPQTQPATPTTPAIARPTVPVVAEPIEPGPPTARLTNKQMLAKARAAVSTAGSAGLTISALNTAMRREGVIISQLPEKNWRSWLGLYGPVFDLDPKGPNAAVRLR